VAVGSSIGHAVSGFFGGGSSQAAEAQPAGNSFATQSADDGYVNAQNVAGGCETDVKAYTQCLQDNKGMEYGIQMSICGWYLDQLVSIFPVVRQYQANDPEQKACQAAASKY
jgi:hypothetical protein